MRLNRHSLSYLSFVYKDRYVFLSAVVIIAFILGLSLAYGAFALLAPLLWMLLLLVLHECSDADLLMGSWAFGFSYLCTSTYWFAYPLHDMLGVPWYACMILLACAFALVACFWCLPFIVHRAFSQRFSIGLLSLPWLFTSFEFLRGFTIFALPWTWVGYTVLYIPLLKQIIPYTGVFISGYLLIHFACFLMHTVIGSKTMMRFYAVFFAGLMLFYLHLPPTLIKADRHLPLQIIQANMTVEDKLSDNYRRYAERLLSSSSDALTIFPEASMSLAFNTEDDRLLFLEYLKPYSGIIGLSYVANDAPKHHIDLVGFGDVSGIHHKQYLVPFGEYIPGLSAVLPWLRPFIADDLYNNMRPFIHAPMQSTQISLLDYRNILSYPFLCYEGFFPPISSTVQSRSHLNIIAVENAWYRASIFHNLMVAVSRFQAIQSLKTTILSSNRGPSMVITPKGNIARQTVFDQQDTLSSNVLLSQGRPYYHSGYDSVIIAGFVVYEWLCLFFTMIWIHYAKRLFTRKN